MRAATALRENEQNHDHARIAFSPRNLENDLSYEVSHLEQMVTNGLKNLHSACQQMKQVEQDLQAFLSEYYAQLGCFYKQLDMLRSEIAEYDRRIAKAKKAGRRPVASRSDALLQVLREELPALPERLSFNDWEAEIKGIYHRLVALYRPAEQAESRYSAKVLQLINQAYAKQDLWAMREIEHSLVEHKLARQDTPESKVSRLRERFEAIAESVARAASRKTWLESSEAWRLKQRMEEDNYLVEVLIHRAKQQIEEARKLLGRKKIEYNAIIA